MRLSILFAALALLTSIPVHSTTWLVGPTRTYTAPSKVSGLVGNGDTVAIDAGVYDSDVTRWSASNLVLKGIGGYAHLRANGMNFGGKAIWVISGNNTAVESIEFSECTCPDHNGAGIRQEGNNLTVRRCYFHDNEDGILGGGDATSNLLIEYSEFSGNGYGDGYSHNLYIGNINSLTFQFNYSHGAVVGHELKSRAYHNYILYNRIANGATGTASREIDLPNGGTSIIIGNEIQQGPQGSNSNIIGYGLEGLSNPVPHRLILINNSVVNERGNGSFVNIQDSTEFLRMYGNLFAGSGASVVGTSMGIDTVGNMELSLAGAGFIDRAGYDYHLLPSSPAVGMASDPGSEGNYPLAPAFEYVHPANGEPRIANGPIDIGAHEYNGVAGVPSDRQDAVAIGICPNPVSTSAIIRCAGINGISLLMISNAIGVDVRRISLDGAGEVVIARGDLPAGIYFGRIIRNDGSVVRGLRFVMQ